MEKKILLVQMGGTICSKIVEDKHVLADSMQDKNALKSFLTKEYSGDLFEEANFWDKQILSENSTLQTYENLYKNLKKIDQKKYQGIVILTGTDTLAYLVAFFSFLLCNTKIPIMFVSAFGSVDQENSNAKANFSCATSLILKGIRGGVYAPYQNTNGKMYLHNGYSIMQCGNFSNDFFSKNNAGIMLNKDFSNQELYNQKTQIQEKNCNILESLFLRNLEEFEKNILIVFPYPGMNFDRVNLDNAKGVLLGTFHSGTVNAEMEKENRTFKNTSAFYLIAKCKKLNIPVYIAPSNIEKGQYSTVFDIVENTQAKVLNMTLESAYAKLVLGVSIGLKGCGLDQFMQTNFLGEIQENQ